MRINTDDDIRSLLEETLKTAKAGKRAAEDTRLLVIWTQVASWIKTALFLVLVVGVVYFGSRAYSDVRRMTDMQSAESTLRDALQKP